MCRSVLNIMTDRLLDTHAGSRQGTWRDFHTRCVRCAVTSKGRVTTATKQSKTKDLNATASSVKWGKCLKGEKWGAVCIRPHNTCDDTFSSTQCTLREEVENWNCSGQGKQAWESTGGSSEKRVEGNQFYFWEERLSGMLSSAVSELQSTGRAARQLSPWARSQHLWGGAQGRQSLGPARSEAQAEAGCHLWCICARFLSIFLHTHCLIK